MNRILPLHPAPSPRRFDPKRRAAFVLSASVLVAGVAAAYANTLSVPFLLDDDAAIRDNLSIRRLSSMAQVLHPPASAGVGGRPILNLSYALNYAANGLNLAGLHATNLLIHALAAVALFALIRITLEQPPLANRFARDSAGIALAASALWAWHPLLTQSVTYLSQRAESLMSLFYLLTLIGFVQSCRCERPLSRRLGLGLSVGACLLGVGTKEVIITVPAAAILYDRAFLSGSFRAAWRHHWRAFALLAVAVLPIVLRIAGSPRPATGYSSQAHFAAGATAWTYALTESKALLTYLRLAFWPSPLLFDYGSHGVMLTRLGQAWPYLALLAVLLAGTAVLLALRPAASFPVVWFFLILAPTSSVVPVPGAPIGENRVYLALAGMAVLLVGWGYARWGRRFLVVIAIPCLALGYATVLRNRTYATELGLWSDTVAKKPDNPRARVNYANALMKAPGRAVEAVPQYEEALRLQPDDFVAYADLTFALHAVGRPGEALDAVHRGLQINPNYAPFYLQLGNLEAELPGRQAEAEKSFRSALQLDPSLVDAHINVANLCLQRGDWKAAVDQYRQALTLNPSRLDAHYYCAAALLQIPGQKDEALAEIGAVLNAEPASQPALRLRKMILSQ